MRLRKRDTKENCKAIFQFCGMRSSAERRGVTLIHNPCSKIKELSELAALSHLAVGIPSDFIMLVCGFWLSQDLLIYEQELLPKGLSQRACIKSAHLSVSHK